MGIDFLNLDLAEGAEELRYELRPPAVPRSQIDAKIEGRSGWVTNVLFSLRPGVRGLSKLNRKNMRW